MILEGLCTFANIEKICFYIKMLENVCTLRIIHDEDIRYQVQDTYDLNKSDTYFLSFHMSLKAM